MNSSQLIIKTISLLKLRVLFLRAMQLIMILLITFPYGRIMACACSEMAIGQGKDSSTLFVDDMGELRSVQSDIMLPGVIPVELTRRYQSFNFGTGMFGMGWSVNFVSYMMTTTGDLQINFVGKIETFKASNGYSNANGSMQASFTDTNEVTVTDTLANKWIFNTTDGTLKEQDDRNGNKVTFTWKVEQINFLGNTVSVYCPLTITFPGNRTIGFTYSGTAGMTHLCTQASSPSGFTVSYSYTQNLLTGISKSNGQTLAYAYHTIVDSAHSDRVSGWLTKLTYADASEINVAYNGQYEQNTIKVVGITGPLDYSRSYTYSDSPTTVTATDSLGNDTSLISTNSGKTKDEVNALGNYTESIKNDKYLTTSFRDLRGKYATYTYDSSNTNPLAQANQLTMTNPLGKIWNYSYDGNNNVTCITDPNGNTVTNTYDSARNILTTKNGLNQTITTNTYTTGGFAGLLLTSKNGVNDQRNYTYNDFGLLSKITDAEGKEWKYEYDSNGAGNLVKVTNPLSKEWISEYNGFYKVSKTTDPLGNETNYEYDDMANLTKTTDAEGGETEWSYDSLQRVTAIKNELNNIAYITYDPESNITKIKDQLGHEYKYAYDDIYNMTQFKYPDNSFESYEYDAGKNLTKITRLDTKEITFTYDDANRRVNKTWIDATNTVFTYSYDDASRFTGVTKVISSSTIGATVYSYNAANKITSVVDNSLTTSYDYDNAERVKKITYPSSEVVNYTFNTRDSLDAVKDVSNNNIVIFTYDDASRLIKRTYPNGLECIYEYNNLDWIVKISLREAATPTNVRQSFEYTYDSVGNIVGVKYANGSGDVYLYDDSYQLIGVKYGVSNPSSGYASASGASRAVTYSYDAGGNRTQYVDGSTTSAYSTNNLNQYTQVGSNSSFAYDSNGNLTSNGTWTYQYDREGNLITASKSGTNVSYKYDGLGRRIEKNVNGTITKFCYSGYDLIEERDNSNNVLAKYIYGGVIDHPIKVIKGSNAYYFQQDAVGNITALTDGSGQMFENYSYDAFGVPTIKDSSNSVISNSATPFLFAGREYDCETGLYNYRSRVYSPELGRFLQRDKLLFRAGDLNLYRYVGNNPINLTDPLGMEEIRNQVSDDFGSKCCPDEIKTISVEIRPTNPFKGDVGHACIQTPNQTTGFYPQNHVGFDNPSSPGDLRDDSHKKFPKRKDYKACPASVKKVDDEINKDKANPPEYNFRNENGGQNCIGWASNKIKDAGGNPPYNPNGPIRIIW